MEQPLARMVRPQGQLSNKDSEVCLKGITVPNASEDISAVEFLVASHNQDEAHTHTTTPLVEYFCIGPWQFLRLALPMNYPLMIHAAYHCNGSLLF